MGDIGKTVSGWFEELSGNTLQGVADKLKGAFNVPPGIGTDAEVSRALDAPLEPNKTLTGGRRHKTRKHKHRGKKTKKRSRRS